MFVDIYTHILPKKYQEQLEKKVTGRDETLPSTLWSRKFTTLMDLDARFRIMDDFPGYIQVITIASPPTYHIAPPKVAVELCRIANDELAELVRKYPGRFAAGIATLPMNDPDAAVAEAIRAIKDLRLRGVELFSDINGKPLDSPEFLPLYQTMEELNRPVFIHPLGEKSTPDYPTLSHSKYRLWTKVGWPFATTLALCHLVYGGVFDKCPNLQVVTHHSGGAVPYLVGRFDWADGIHEMLMGETDIDLKDHGLNYFRRINYDTAVSGNTAALQCTKDFAGVNQMYFGTDAPFDNQLGRRLIRQTIESVERLGLSDEDQRKVFQDNAIRLLRLPLGIF